MGLGNPGPQYSSTRHNAGFFFIDRIAEIYPTSLKKESKFHGYAGKVEISGTTIWLLKPETFMNRSGEAVGALARFYRIPAESILVVHDELDLPPGNARLKLEGGHGGHNGLRDIMAKLGQRNFRRLRLGIGHPGDAKLVSPYVLGKAPKGEQQLLDSAIEDAIEILPSLIAGDMPRAMNQLHTTR